MRKLFTTSVLALGLAAGTILGGAATAQAGQSDIRWRLLDGRLYDHYLTCMKVGEDYARAHGGSNECTGSGKAWVALIEVGH